MAMDSAARSPRARRRLPLAALSLALLACTRAATPTAPDARCDVGDATPGLTLLTRAREVLVTRDGRYVLSLADGVAVFDGCRVERLGGCRDARGVHRMMLRASSSAVDYLRPDGSTGACDLARSVALEPDLTARASLAAPPERVGRAATLSIVGAAAWLHPRGGVRRRLPLDAEALSVALDEGLGVAAVGDAVGAVWLFTVPTGMLLERVQAHARNVTGVALDGPRRRLLSVAGHGRFDARALPPAAEAWARRAARGGHP